MHASMVTLSVKDGQLEDMVTKYRQDLLPLILAVPGCLKSYIFADPKNIVVRLLAMWTSEAHATAPEARSVFQTLIQALTPYLATPPVREIFEVRYGE